MNAEGNSMSADDSEQDDITDMIKEVLYAPRDNPLTQSKVSLFQDYFLTCYLYLDSRRVRILTINTR